MSSPIALLRRMGLHPAAGSLAEHELRAGRSPWWHLLHLGWSIWVFLTPLFAGGLFGYTARWALLTAISYPVFVALFFLAVFARPRIAYGAALAMIALCLALLPWYPSGLSYFVFGCVFLQPRRPGRLYGYLALLVALNAALILFAVHLGYPWLAVVWLPFMTAMICSITMVDRINEQRDAALKLSQEEVRRLAAVAERERIGRDLHDLLGHTLSLVALKADLASRLIDAEPSVARREIDAVGQVARDALAQVRRAVSGIRSARLAAELASAKLLLEMDGITFSYQIDADIPAMALTGEIENALAMTVREAATNIQRHAKASRAEIRLDHGADGLILHIIDDGRGGISTHGTGLAGMRERLVAIGAELSINSPRAEGTRLIVRLPETEVARPAPAHTSSANLSNDPHPAR